MGSTVRTTNNIPRITRALREIGRKEIQVGVFDGGEIGMIAAVHEYGTKIPVTQKMRGWFGANGFPLRKDTQYIVIPERSFIRGGYDEYIDKTADKIETLLPHVISLALDSSAFLDAIGTDLASHIKKYMNELDDPPNADMTVERKNSSNPLIDSGRLRGAITHRLE